jgi:hypothetical protein
MTQFSITGIPPFYLDFSSEYRVLAIIVRLVRVGEISPSLIRGKIKIKVEPPSLKSIYAKRTYFLIADKDQNFRCLPEAQSSFYNPSNISIDMSHHDNRRVRYSLNNEIGENRDMIYPIRAFSITGISMEGFDPGKAYPVLAIDMDQYIPENQENEDTETRGEQPSQSLAFFLVWDDNGEFAWVAEDECKLYPLDNK